MTSADDGAKARPSYPVRCVASTPSKRVRLPAGRYVVAQGSARSRPGGGGPGPGSYEFRGRFRDRVAGPNAAISDGWRVAVQPSLDSAQGDPAPDTGMTSRTQRWLQGSRRAAARQTSRSGGVRFPGYVAHRGRRAQARLGFLSGRKDTARCRTKIKPADSWIIRVHKPDPTSKPPGAARKTPRPHRVLGWR